MEKKKAQCIVISKEQFCCFFEKKVKKNLASRSNGNTLKVLMSNDTMELENRSQIIFDFQVNTTPLRRQLIIY